MGYTLSKNCNFYTSKPKTTSNTHETKKIQLYFYWIFYSINPRNNFLNLFTRIPSVMMLSINQIFFSFHLWLCYNVESRVSCLNRVFCSVDSTKIAGLTNLFSYRRHKQNLLFISNSNNLESCNGIGWEEFLMFK